MPRPALPRPPTGLLLALLAVASCESATPTGGLFEPVSAGPASPAPASPDLLAFPTEAEEGFKLSSEDMAKGTVGLGTATGINADDLPVPAGAEALPSAPAGSTAQSPASPAAPSAPVLGLPSSPWPVRVVSTLPQAQPPRAILGLPDGSERVVSPGSMLPELGLVVMSVAADRVGLAKVTAAGDHAAIESVEIGPQYR